MLPLRLSLLKYVDRRLGRWICRHATPTTGIGSPGGAGAGSSPEPLDPKGVRRILIIRPGGLGDAVLTYPMIHALLGHFTKATIDVLGERRNSGVYRITGLVGQIHRYDVNPIGTLRNLMQNDYDLIIDTEQYHYLSSVIANAIKPNYICGFDTLGRGRLQSHRVAYNENSYEVLLFLNLAAAVIGRPQHFQQDRPFITVAEQWQEWAAEELNRPSSEQIAVIVPGASTHHKFWSPARYAAVVSWLIKRGYFVVILGADDAVSTAGVVSGAHGSERLLNLAGKTTVPQAAGIVERANLYVSSDTGLLHIAYGVGTPTVHMFGSGIQEKWAPQGMRYIVVNKELPCSPCTRYGHTPPCPYEVACMDAIGVDDVLAAIEEVLRR